MESATHQEIINRAEEILGKTILSICKDKTINARDKGQIGNIIQEFGFSIKPNNDAAPDFTFAKIELKVVPLERYKKGENYRIKERTKVCSIDYNKLIEQSWDKSNARKKLDKILFIFYVYDRANPTQSIVERFLLYNLNENNSDEIILKDDWQKIQTEVINGHAHLLTEKLTKVLASSRSGTGKGKDYVTQPKSVDKALKRAFSLKPCFTRVLWNELNQVEYDSLPQNFNNSSEIEEILLRNIKKLVGKTIFEVSEIYKLSLTKAKNAAAKLVKAALGLSDNGKPIKEVEQLGISIKIVPVNSENDMPWEAMSFPYQPLNSIKEEESFENSELADNLQALLIIPIYRNTRKLNIKEAKIGHPFIWKPNYDEIMGISKEWDNYRKIISDGISSKKKAVNTPKRYKVITNLPGQSKTRYIHIRPHARDSHDLDPSLNPKLKICKQSFWLNKSFLKSLIEKNK